MHYDPREHRYWGYDHNGLIEVPEAVFNQAPVGERMDPDWWIEQLFNDEDVEWLEGPDDMTWCVWTVCERKGGHPHAS